MLRCGFGRVCRLMMFTPSTISRFVVGRTFNTRPRLPLSLPVTTATLSFFRIGVCSLDIFAISGGPEDPPLRFSPSPHRRLQHLGGERDDLHEPPLAQLAGHGPEHARAD